MGHGRMMCCAQLVTKRNGVTPAHVWANPVAAEAAAATTITAVATPVALSLRPIVLAVRDGDRLGSGEALRDEHLALEPTTTRTTVSKTQCTATGATHADPVYQLHNLSRRWTQRTGSAEGFKSSASPLFSPSSPARLQGRRLPRN